MEHENIICNCMQVTLEEILQAIAAGAITLECVAESTGATTGCSRCKGIVTKTLHKNKS